MNGANVASHGDDTEVEWNPQIWKENHNYNNLQAWLSYNLYLTYNPHM